MSASTAPRSSGSRWRWPESCSFQPVSPFRCATDAGAFPFPSYKKGGPTVLLLVLLAILAILLFGVGFTVHWLFILAIVAALLFVISFFMGAARGRSRGPWWYPTASDRDHRVAQVRGRAPRTHGRSY